MELLELLEERRSVRKYQQREVEREKLEKILKASILSPTGRNFQGLSYAILADSERKERLLSALGVDKNFYSAPAILFIFERKEDHLNELNCGGACMSAIIEATSLGVSSCWIHSARQAFNSELGKEKVKECFDFTEERNVLECVALGYREGELPAFKERESDDCFIL